MMIQLGKGLLCKHKDPSSNPQNPCKSWAQQCMSRSGRSSNSGIFRASWPVASGVDKLLVQRETLSPKLMGGGGLVK